MSNRNTLKQKMKNYLNHPGSLIMMLLVMFGAILTFLVLIFLIVYILVHGVPYLSRRCSLCITRRRTLR